MLFKIAVKTSSGEFNSNTNYKWKREIVTYDLRRKSQMVRRSREEAQRMLRAFAVLVKNTTWKCGRVERLVVNHLREQLRRFGKARSPVKEMLQRFKLKGKQKSEFFDAIKRLEKRRIIKIETF